MPREESIVQRDEPGVDVAMPAGSMVERIDALLPPSIPTADAVALVYQELRRLARARLRRERAGHSLQPTGLAHETVMRILACGRREWDSRGHFFAAASEIMRRVLVDAARHRGRIKRGAGLTRLPVPVDALADRTPADDVIALGEAVADLAKADAEAAELVRLRYFGGLTMVEAAAAMGISTRSAERVWAFARAWLARELGAAARAG